MLKISDRMIDAGVEALQRRGYGLDNEPTDLLRVAVEAVFRAMAEASHRKAKRKVRLTDLLRVTPRHYSFKASWTDDEIASFK